MKSLFFRKPTEVLLSIDEEMSITDSMFKSRTSWDHTSKTLKAFKRNNLINMEKQGRKRIITLTNKGREIKQMLESIREELR